MVNETSMMAKGDLREEGGGEFKVGVKGEGEKGGR